MWPIVIDRVALSVYQSVTVVSPAKMAQPMKMLFGLRTPVGQGTMCQMGGPDPPWEGAVLRGKG